MVIVVPVCQTVFYDWNQKARHNGRAFQFHQITSSTIIRIASPNKSRIVGGCVYQVTNLFRFFSIIKCASKMFLPDDVEYIERGKLAIRLKATFFLFVFVAVNIESRHRATFHNYALQRHGRGVLPL
jgi:hypothetical protein